jgi:hypothetical protein
MTELTPASQWSAWIRMIRTRIAAIRSTELEKRRMLRRGIGHRANGALGIRLVRTD